MYIKAESNDGKYSWHLSERGAFEQLCAEVNDDLLDGTEPYDDDDFTFVVAGNVPGFVNCDEEIDYSTGLDYYLDAIENYQDGSEEYKAAVEYLVEEDGMDFLSACDSASNLDVYIGDSEDAAKYWYGDKVPWDLNDYVDWHQLGQDKVDRGDWKEYDSPHGTGASCIIFNP